MPENTSNLIEFPANATQNALEEILRDGARKMLIQAIEDEVDFYIEAYLLAPPHSDNPALMR